MPPVWLSPPVIVTVGVPVVVQLKIPPEIFTLPLIEIAVEVPPVNLKPAAPPPVAWMFRLPWIVVIFAVWFHEPPVVAILIVTFPIVFGRLPPGAKVPSPHLVITVLLVAPNVLELPGKSALTPAAVLPMAL